MTDIYTQEDLPRAQKQQKRLLTIMLAVTLFWAACITAALLLRRRVLPETASEWICIGLTVLWGAVLIFLFDLKLKPVHAYVRYLGEVTGGIRREMQGIVVSLDQEVSYRNGFDFYRLILNVDEKGDPEGERQFFFDANKPRPALVPGEAVALWYHGNDILAYQRFGPPEVSDG